MVSLFAEIVAKRNVSNASLAFFDTRIRSLSTTKTHSSATPKVCYPTRNLPGIYFMVNGKLTVATDPQDLVQLSTSRKGWNTKSSQKKCSQFLAKRCPWEHAKIGQKSNERMKKETQGTRYTWAGSRLVPFLFPPWIRLFMPECLNWDSVQSGDDCAKERGQEKLCAPVLMLLPSLQQLLLLQSCLPCFRHPSC